MTVRIDREIRKVFVTMYNNSSMLTLPSDMAECCDAEITTWAIMQICSIYGGL